MKFLLASTLLRSLWAIDETFAISQMAFVESILSGNNLLEDMPKDILSAVNVPTGRQSSFSDAPKNSIALVDIQGPMMKHSYCSLGMKAMGELIQEADSHPNIMGIILKIDSPGGTVDGVYELGEIVKNTKKPIVAHTDGMIASAAYWVASQCDSIIANNKTASIGSIGVMLSISDYKPKYEKEGVKYHTVYASQSKDKNRLETQILEGKYDEYRQTILDPLACEFITKVKTCRATISEDVLTGKMFFADDALKNGLIDKIGGIESAIEIIINSQKIPQSMEKLPLLMALLGLTELSFSAEGLSLNEEQLSTLETALSAARATRITQKTVSETVSAAVTEKKIDNLANLQAQVDKLQQENKVLQSRVDELEETPSAKGGGADTVSDFPQSNDTSFNYLNS